MRVDWNSKLRKSELLSPTLSIIGYGLQKLIIAIKSNSARLARLKQKEAHGITKGTKGLGRHG